MTLAAVPPKPSLAGGILRMLRPPNIFTAIAEPIAGLAIARGGALVPSDRALSLIPASAALYLGGLALNDYFDREVDARERPDRPIPSGAVPAGLAAALGAGLLLAGIGLAGIAATACLMVAVPLALCIAAYDALPRGSTGAFLLMGLCRALNFAMPLVLLPAWSLPTVAAPLLLGAYITAITYLARDEVQGNTQARAKRGVVFMAVIAAVITAVFVFSQPAFVAWAWLITLLLRWGGLFLPLWRHADPRTTGRAIGGGILTVPLFDSLFVALCGYPGWALAVAALVIPAIVLRRVYYVT